MAKKWLPFKSKKLPDYVVVNDPKCTKKEVLQTPSETIQFPLSDEDLKVIADMEAVFDQEENMAGLAAPQIGYHKRIIIFAVPDDPELKIWRSDLTDTMTKSIWINPSYKPVGDEKFKDWEGCFSVHDLAGGVARYSEITYEAFTPEGKKISGKARGFLARVIQHEVDHTNGKLFIDRDPDPLITLKELRKMREQQKKEKEKLGE